MEPLWRESVVDGVEVRWTVEHGRFGHASIVAHLPGLEVVERLRNHERVEPGRIEALTRHLVSNSREGCVELTPPDLCAPPRKRDHYDWMRALGGALQVFARITREVEVGRVFWEADERGGVLSADLRFACDVVEEAAAWEGRLVIRGDEDGASCEGFAFPFDADGTSLALARRSSWLFVLERDDDSQGFRSAGWRPWTKSEWDHVTAPGVLFATCELRARRNEGSAELVAELADPLAPPADARTLRCSVHSLVGPEGQVLLAPGAVRWDEWAPERVALVDHVQWVYFDAAWLTLAVGHALEPGTYQVSLAIRGQREGQSGSTEVTDVTSVELLGPQQRSLL